MKPWKLCVNKQSSYKIDSRGIIDIYKIKVPCLDSNKRSDCNKQGDCNKKYNINYDFVNMRPTNTKFVCRFLDNSADNPVNNP